MPSVVDSDSLAFWRAYPLGPHLIEMGRRNWRSHSQFDRTGYFGVPVQRVDADEHFRVITCGSPHTHTPLKSGSTRISCPGPGHRATPEQWGRYLEMWESLETNESVPEEWATVAPLAD